MKQFIVGLIFLASIASPRSFSNINSISECRVSISSDQYEGDIDLLLPIVENLLNVKGYEVAQESDANLELKFVTIAENIIIENDVINKDDHSVEYRRNGSFASVAINGTLNGKKVSIYETATKGHWLINEYATRMRLAEAMYSLPSCEDLKN